MCLGAVDREGKQYDKTQASIDREVNLNLISQLEQL